MSSESSTSVQGDQVAVPAGDIFPNYKVSLFLSIIAECLLLSKKKEDAAAIGTPSQPNEEAGAVASYLLSATWSASSWQIGSSETPESALQSEPNTDNGSTSKGTVPKRLQSQTSPKGGRPNPHNQ